MKRIQYIILLSLFLGVILYNLIEKDYISSLRNNLDKDAKYASERSNAFFPSPVFFCEEEIPLTEPDVLERFNKELNLYIKYRSNTKLLFRRAERWLPQIEKVLERQGLPTDLKYLVVVESAFTNVTSRRGAAGFWQIRAITGRTLGLKINEEVDERLEPIRATSAAARYFKLAYKNFDNWTMAAASYNMGISGLERQVKKQKPDTFYDLKLNKETYRYVFKAIAFKEIYENQAKYEFAPQIAQSPDDDLKSFELDQSIEDLSEFAKMHLTHADSIRKYNPWIVGNKILLDRDQEITLYFPEVKVDSIQLSATELNPVEAEQAGILSDQDMQSK
ncbi:MAG: murein transglycosylase [Thalassobius sp.]|nr:murein transglycosylase [Thalassovita sp.]